MRTCLLALFLSTAATALSAANQLAAEASATPGRKTVRVKVVNASPHVIHEAYICPSARSTWGDNLLTQGPLRPGKRALLRFAGSCGVYDLRFVADKGTEYLEEELEFCDDDDVVTIGGGAIKRVKPSGR